MARPITISDQQILDAARALVTERGMLATSQQIALRANVSEGTLFKRFRTKTQLLQVALGVEPAHVSAPFEELGSRGQSTVTSLREAGRAFIELRVRAETLAGRSGRAALALDDSAMKHRIVELVRDYIAAQAPRDAAEPLGARALAVAFVSALFGLELSEGYERDLEQVMTLILRDLADA